MIDNCLTYVESYTTIKSHQSIIRKDIIIFWKPPLQGKVKLNFDCALFHSYDSKGVEAYFQE